MKNPQMTCVAGRRDILWRRCGGAGQMRGRNENRVTMTLIAPVQFIIAAQSKPVERRGRRVTGLRRRHVARSAGPPANRPSGLAAALLFHAPAPRDPEVS